MLPLLRIAKHPLCLSKRNIRKREKNHLKKNYSMILLLCMNKENLKKMLKKDLFSGRDGGKG